MGETYENYEVGDRVYGIGRGESKWDPQPVGDVVAISEGQGSVFVQWDNSSVEDEMNPWEVRPAK
jgi:hypothetical protein